MSLGLILGEGKIPIYTSWRKRVANIAEIDEAQVVQ